MSTTLDERQQWFDSQTRELLNDGKVYIGKVGLDPTVAANQLSLFSDRALTVAITNPQTTNTNGQTEDKIWFAEEKYSISVTDSAGAVKYTELDNGVLDEGLTSIADMNFQGSEGQIVTPISFHPGLNKGGGDFWYDSTQDTANHNGIDIIDPRVIATIGSAAMATWSSATQTTYFTAVAGNTGCWMRIYDGAIIDVWSGAKRNASTDDLIPLTNWAATPDSILGGELEATAGVAVLSDKLPITNRPISIKGAGVGVSIFQFGVLATGGIEYSTDNILDDFTIDGLTIIGSRGAGSGNGLSVTFPTTASYARQGPIIKNLEITNLNSSSYWGNGILLTECWQAALSNIWVGSIGSGRVSATSCITLAGESNDVRIDTIYMRDSSVGIDITGTCEGFYGDKIVAIGQDIGLRALMGSTEPGFFLSKSHFNTYVRGVQLDGRSQGSLTETLFYKHSSSSDNYIGVSLTNSDDFRLQSNMMRGVGIGGSEVSVSITTSNRFQVKDNQFTGHGTGISIDASSDNGQTSGNVRDTVTTLVSDLGTGNVHNNPVPDGHVTFTDADATPRVDQAQGGYFISSPTGALSITDFDNGIVNQTITVLAGNANTTLVHSASINLQGASNFTMGSGAMITLEQEVAGGRWREISRRT